jgi:hypothetical protein
MRNLLDGCNYLYEKLVFKQIDEDGSDTRVNLEKQLPLIPSNSQDLIIITDTESDCEIERGNNKLLPSIK